MGCGKSYWGRLLAQKHDLPFLDLDILLEEQQRKTILEIFAEKGEIGFRRLERDTLRTLADHPASIVATGGGTPCFFDNMAWMNSVGETVYLKTPPALLAARLSAEIGKRPLLLGLQGLELQSFIEQKLAEREGFYLQSKIVLEQNDEDSQILKQLAPHVL